MKHQPAGSKIGPVTRAAVAQQIAERLAGRLTDTALAKWAFDSFYVVELAEDDLEDDAPRLETDALLAEALDALMFGDDPDFRLSEAALHELATRLTAQG
jgi:hypothetical protein